MKHQMELAGFMEAISQGGIHSIDPTEIKMSIEEVKDCIRIQIEYLKSEGVGLVDDIIHAIEGWSPEQKQVGLTLLTAAVSDEAFEDGPEIDE